MYKIFPLALIQDSPDKPLRKAPLIKGWQTLATTDVNQHQAWLSEWGDKLKLWGVPTGPESNILVLDVDVKGGGLETIKKYHVPLTTSQTTMSGGTHYFFKYPNDGRDYGNRVGFDHGLDIRGKGGYVAFYGTDTLPLAEAPDWLLAYCLKKTKSEIDTTDMIRIAPEIVEQILTEATDNIRDAPEGESNNILNIESFKIGQLLPSGSIDKDHAYNSLFKAAKDRGKPDYESKATINSGLQGGSNTPLTCPFGNEAPVLTMPIIGPEKLTRWTPNFFTRYDLTNLSKLRKPQIFKDWSTEDIHLTTADGGTGKTTLKLFEAICLALGESFLGFECMGEGRTLFITGEDTALKLAAMIGAILKQMGLMDGTPENNEKVKKVMNNVLIKKDSDLCLIAKDKQGFLVLNSEAMRKVTEAIEDIRPKLIVFDPISSFWGSESALNDMAKAVSKFTAVLVEKADACVEIINHMGKASSTNKDMSQFAGRGGTGLPSHARVSRVLRPIFDEEYTELTGMVLADGQSAMMCNVNKFSDGSPLYNKPFLIIREGYLFSRVVLTEVKVKEEQEKMDDNERLFTFIREERKDGRYPTKGVVIGHFMRSATKISKARVLTGLEFLHYAGHMGEKIKLVGNPDMDVKERVYIVTDMEGKEL